MKLPPRRQFLHLAAGAAAVPAVSRIARAQAYPSRPVRIDVVLMRSRGELLGYVDATDAQAAEAVVAEQFRLDGWQRRRLLVQELD